MPCHSYNPEELFNENFTYTDFLILNQKIEENKKELDKVTRLLCATLRRLETEHDNNLKADGQFYSHPYLPEDYLDEIEGLEAWWTEHKKWDELRLIREEAQRKEAAKQNLIKEALSKLTDKEKEALGL